MSYYDAPWSRGPSPEEQMTPAELEELLFEPYDVVENGSYKQQQEWMRKKESDNLTLRMENARLRKELEGRGDRENFLPSHELNVPTMAHDLGVGADSGLLNSSAPLTSSDTEHEDMAKELQNLREANAQLQTELDGTIKELGDKEETYRLYHENMREFTQLELLHGETERELEEQRMAMESLRYQMDSVTAQLRSETAEQSAQKVELQSQLERTLSEKLASEKQCAEHVERFDEEKKQFELTLANERTEKDGLYADIQNLHEEIAEVTKRHAEAESDIQALRAEKMSVQEMLKKAETELQDEIAKHREREHELVSIIDQMEIVHKEIIEKNEQFRLSCESMTSELNDLKRKEERLNRELVEQEKLYEDLVAGKAAERDEDVQKMEHELGKQHDLLQRLEHELTRAKESAAVVEQERDEIVAELSRAAAQINSDKDSTLALRAEIDRLEKSLQAKMDLEETSIVTFKCELQSELNKCRAEVEAAQKSQEETRALHNDTVAALAAANDEKERLTLELGEREKLCEELVSKLIEREAVVKNLEQECDNKQQAAEAGEKQDLTAQVDQLRASLKLKEQQLVDLSTKLEKVEQKRDAFAEELSSLAAQVDSSEMYIASLRSNVEIQESIVKSLNEKLDVADSDLADAWQKQLDFESLLRQTQNDLNTTKTELCEKIQELKEQKLESARLEQSIADLDFECKRGKNVVVRETETIDEQRTLSVANEERIGALRAEIDRLQTLLEHAEMRTEELFAAAQEALSLREEIESQEDALREAQCAQTRVESESRRAYEELDRVKKVLSDREESLALKDSLDARCHALERELLMVQAELNDAVNSRHELAAELSSAMARSDSTKETLSSLHAQVARLESLLQHAQQKDVSVGVEESRALQARLETLKSEQEAKCKALIEEQVKYRQLKSDFDAVLGTLEKVSSAHDALVKEQDSASSPWTVPKMNTFEKGIANLSRSISEVEESMGSNYWVLRSLRELQDHAQMYFQVAQNAVASMHEILRKHHARQAAKKNKATAAPRSQKQTLHSLKPAEKENDKSSRHHQQQQQQQQSL